MPGDTNNSVEVVIQKLHGELVLGIACGGEEMVWYEAKAGKYQWKDGVLHIRTWVINVPVDNCIVPSSEEGIVHWEVFGGTMTITPSGIIVFREINND